MFAVHGARVTAGCVAAGADYEGMLLVRLRLRITDHSSGDPASICASGTVSSPWTTATVQDFQISIPVQCVNNGGANGGNCALTTTLDSLEPGSVNELQRQVMEIRLFAVTDMGADGKHHTDSFERSARPGVPSGLWQW